jgi:hypothetical protein
VYYSTDVRAFDAFNIVQAIAGAYTGWHWRRTIKPKLVAWLTRNRYYLAGVGIGLLMCAAFYAGTISSRPTNDEAANYSCYQWRGHPRCCTAQQCWDTDA